MQQQHGHGHGSKVTLKNGVTGMSDELTEVWEAYECNGSNVAIFIDEKAAREFNGFTLGTDLVSKAKLFLTKKQRDLMKENGYFLL